MARLLCLMLCCLAATVSSSSSSLVIGDVRVTALSPSLVRIEPRGPTGFEDRATFNVVGRDSFGDSLPLTIINQSATTGTWLAAGEAYHVYIPAVVPSAFSQQCSPQAGMDAVKPTRLPKYPQGVKNVVSAMACCELCTAESDCVAWTYNTQGKQCWPFAAVVDSKVAQHRVFGRVDSGNLAQAIVATPAGHILYNGSNTFDGAALMPSNVLHWPSPLDGSTAYAFEDRPRFTVPEWGPTPIPSNASAAPGTLATNGYDFGNDVHGDTYIFLLHASGESKPTLNTWWAAREAFLSLTGPTPLLPDWAYGIWYTWYIRYTEERAKHEIGNWTQVANLPLDVWGLDMNWRLVGINDTTAGVAACKGQTTAAADPRCRDHFYNQPNVDLMPGLAAPDYEWFNYLEAQGLKTYFNDHPFPVANQTTPQEVAFRYQGLSRWLERGLTFFWFDHNWGFTLPGPRMPYNTKADYEGLSGAVWGSHVYYESTRHALAKTPGRQNERPIALSRDNGPNWKTDNPDAQIRTGAGAPAHHRFPVWWTGDGVPLMASVESMVNEALHDFRGFVHSDCGGHGDRSSCPATLTGAPPEDKACTTPNDAALLRWTAHCVLGTVVRYHQGDHRFWLRSNATQDTARSYLQMRHALAPSLTAAGRTLQHAGFPLTARCDLLWPEYPEARDPTQYIHLNSTLVAPLDVEPVDKVDNSRTVWVPPGDWVDGWTGAVLSGPQKINVTQPPSRIPMWHRKGTLLVTALPSPSRRLTRQNWTELTVHAWPATGVAVGRREVYAQESAEAGSEVPTVVEMVTRVNGTITLSVSPSRMTRSWLVRMQLQRGQRLQLAPGNEHVTVRHVLPASSCSTGVDVDDDYFPLRGEGAPAPCLAGAVAEFRLVSGNAPVLVQASLMQN